MQRRPNLPPARSWDRLAEQHGEAPALSDPHHHPAEQYSFRQLAATIEQFAAGLQSLGLRCGQRAALRLAGAAGMRGGRPTDPSAGLPPNPNHCSKGDKVSLFSENSGRWLVADQAIMKCGAADAVRMVVGRVVLIFTLDACCLHGTCSCRHCCWCLGLSLPALWPAVCLLTTPHPPTHPQVRGTSSTLEELQYILSHSESSVLVVQVRVRVCMRMRGCWAASPGGVCCWSWLLVVRCRQKLGGAGTQTVAVRLQYREGH